MSSSPARPRLSLFLVLSEAIWVTLCFGAVINTWPHFTMDAPYPALAIPVCAAVLLGWVVKGLGWSPRQMAALVALLALLGVAITAGVISEISVPGSFVKVAFAPWAVTGRIASDTSADAWFLGSLAFARGIEVGMARCTFGQTIRSVVVAAFSFFVLFISVATQHSLRLTAATRLAEPAFFVYFLIALALLRLSRALTAEGSATARAQGTSTGVWSAMLAVPLALVALVAFAVAAALGTWGTHVVHAARDVGNAVVWFFTEIGRGIGYVVVHIVDGIVWVVEAIIHLFTHHGLGAGGKTTPITPTTIAPATIVNHHIPLTFVVGLVATTIAAMALVAYRLRKAPTARPAPVAASAEVRGTTFTWRRFLAQILDLIQRALTTVWRRIVHRHQVPVAAAGELAEPVGGVRGEYLRLLVAARASGLGRIPTETAEEFAARVLAVLDDEVLAGDLGRLTVAYEHVRYRDLDQGAPPSPLDRETAVEDGALTATVDGLIAQLTTFAEAQADDEPDPDEVAATAQTVP